MKEDEGLIKGKYDEEEGNARDHVKDGEKKAEKAKERAEKQA